MSSRAEATHQEMMLLAEIAPLGVLDPEAGRSLDRHLRAGCDRCEAGLDRSWLALEVLALTTPLAEPAPEARTRLLSAVDGKVVPLRRRPQPGWLAAAALLLAAVGLGLAAQREIAAARAARAESERALVEASARRGDLIAQSTRLQDAVDVVAGPSPRTGELAGESDLGAARVRILYDPVLERTVLLARELPPPPEGHTYQLWRVDDGVPSSLGIFAPDALGNVLELEQGPLDSITRNLFAVSIEPAGGVASPTGPIVLSGR